jgi:2-polyprenyl-3-methyl-5-hydroxy-6-metoxy-1,4-benzoquinol methylase
MSAIAEIPIDNAARDVDELTGRLIHAATETMNLLAVFIGDQLGLYEALAEAGAMTSVELSRKTATAERYVREWLEQQTVSGITAVEDASSPPTERRYRLPASSREVLAARESLNYLAPIAQLVVGAVSPIERLLDAIRNGGGIAYGDYGRHMREGQARFNRAAFLYQLGPEWLGSIRDIRERLEASPPARVADIGCGGGWSSIGIARTYPNARIDGYDFDQPSIELARRNAEDYGLSDRVRFETRDAGSAALAGRYDLVIALECMHDMSDPVGALSAMRRMAKADGAVVVMDERTNEKFDPGGETDLEKFLYGCSLLHCLPSGMAETPSACTGTVMRADTFRTYARDAGFRDVEILPIDNYFFRFYRLYR